MTGVCDILPNPVYLLETVLVYFLITKLIPWINVENTCWGNGAIYWGVLVLLYLISLVGNARITGGWCLAAVASMFTPILCIAVNPIPFACMGIFGEGAEKDAFFFLEGQAALTAVGAILFGLLSIRVAVAGPRHHSDGYYLQDEVAVGTEAM